MVEKVDVIRAVAEKECPCIASGGLVCKACGPRPDVSTVIHGPACLNCQGTYLRWPTLSREVTWEQDHTEGVDCVYHNASTDRIPDVSIEKIAELVDTIKLDKYCDGWQCWITIEDNDAVYEGYGVCEFGSDKNMPREAACAALLATEE